MGARRTKYSLKRAEMVALTFALLPRWVRWPAVKMGRRRHSLSPTLPTSQELRQAGDELFSAFSAAVQELLVAPLRERCTVEQVQGALAGDVPFLDVDVKAVFLDLENPSRALVRVALQEEPEEGLGGLATTFATLFPFPMVREEGEWRLDLLALAGGRDTEEGCPFAEDDELRDRA